MCSIAPGTDIDTLLATSIAIINIVTVPLLSVHPARSTFLNAHFVYRLLADLFKRKTVLSSIAVEASWLCEGFDCIPVPRPHLFPPVVVWVLWLTCAAYAAWCSQTQLVNFVRCQTSRGGCFSHRPSRRV